MKYLASFLLLACLFCTCIDPVSFDIDTNERKIVVDGQLTDSFSLQQIKVSYSAVIGLGNDNILTPIPGCTVKVLDEAGNVFEFPETAPGIYSKEMKGEPGGTYHLELLTPDGKNIHSDPATLVVSPPLGEIGTEVYVSQYQNGAGNLASENRLRLTMSTNFSGVSVRPYLRWRADGEYEFQESTLAARVCYVKNRVDLNNIRIFNTQLLPGDDLFGEIILTTSLDYRFARQYCFHIFQLSMTRQEYLYWQSVGDIVNIDGSFFDPPPGTVRGNLHNPNDPDEVVTGYFSVAGVSFTRIFVNPQSLGLGFIEPICGGFSPFPPREPECQDCTILGGSSPVKPDYWKP